MAPFDTTGLKLVSPGRGDAQRDMDELISLKPSASPEGLSMRQATPQGQAYRDAVDRVLAKYGGKEAFEQAYQGQTAPTPAPAPTPPKPIQTTQTAPLRSLQATEAEIDALIWVESRGDPNAVSSSGAGGLGQIMPDTARDPGYGVRPLKDRADPVENRRFTTDYYNAMLGEYKGDRTLAGMAYNGGPGTIDEWVAAGSDPDSSLLSDETRNYPGLIADRLGAGAEPSTAETVKFDTSGLIPVFNTSGLKMVEKKPLGVLGTAGAIGGQLVDAIMYHLPGAFASAVEGPEDVYAEKDWKDWLIERGRKRTRETAPTGPEQGTAFPGLNVRDIHSAGPSFGFSGVAAVAGFGAGIPTAFVNVPAGYIVGAGASGFVAYRMAANMFTRDLREAADQDSVQRTGQPMSDKDFAVREKELAGLIQEYGLWEAIPEAASNVLGFGILKVPVKAAIGRLFGDTLLKRIITKTAAVYGIELATETITQLPQHNLEIEAGISDAPTRTFASADDVWTSLKEIAPAVFLVTTIMGGGTKLGIMAQERLQREGLSPAAFEYLRELNARVESAVISPEAAQIEALQSLSPSQDALGQEVTRADLGPSLDTSGLILVDQPAPEPPDPEKEIEQARAEIMEEGTAALKGEPTPALASDEQAVVAPPPEVLPGPPGAPETFEAAGTRENPVTSVADIDAAAPQANLDPTEDQKKAGNYKKVHAKFPGLEITIENPRGSTRSGLDPDGTPWSVQMQAHYGYIKRTVGADGDNVDVYLGLDDDSDRAFIVDQIDPKTGEFDEHKIILGATNLDDALFLYDVHFSDNSGPSRRKAVFEVSVDDFKVWLREGNNKQEFSKYTALDVQEVGEPAATQAEPAWYSDLTRAGREALALAAGTTQGTATRISKMDWQNIPDAMRVKLEAAWPRAQPEAGVFQVEDGEPVGFEPIGEIRPVAPPPAPEPAQEPAPAPEAPVEPPAPEVAPEPPVAIPGPVDKPEPISETLAEPPPQPEPKTEPIPQPVTATGAEIIEELKTQRARLPDGFALNTRGDEINLVSSGGTILRTIGYARRLSLSDLRRELDQMVKMARERSDAETAPKKPRYTVKKAAIIPTRGGVVAIPISEETEEIETPEPIAPGEGGQPDMFGGPEVSEQEMRLREEAANLLRDERAEGLDDVDIVNDAEEQIDRLDGLPGRGYKIKVLREMIGQIEYVPAPIPMKPDVPKTVEKPAEKADIKTQEQPDDGISPTVPTGDAAAGAPDVQPTPPVRDDEDAPQGQVSGGTPAVRPTGGQPAQAPQRPTPVPVRPPSGGGTGVRGVSGLPAAHPAKPKRDDTGRPERAKGDNFSIKPDGLQESRGPTTKARDNIRVIELVREIEAEGRPATAEEQEQLSLYVGWGGLKGAFPDSAGEFGKGFKDVGVRLRDLLPKTEYATARRSIQYAHYTSETIVRGMWQAAERLGFSGGMVFEPGMGIGNFAGFMPADLSAQTDYSGLELDHTSVRIARLLYPRSGVRQDDFTRSPLPKDTFDMAIGNPPFADIAIKSDPDYKQGFLLHDYFFAKTLDGIRPGGLMIFISSAGTLNKLDSKAREYMADRADFVAAIRLPGDAFQKNAGTSVTTDIIILRKRLPGETEGSRDWTETVEVTLPDRDGKDKTGLVNKWIHDNPDAVLGEQGFFDKLYPGRYAVQAAKGADLGEQIQERVDALPTNIMSEWLDGADRAEVDFGTAEHKEGSFYVHSDGRLMQVTKGVGFPVQRRGKGVKGGKTASQVERIKALIPIRDALRETYKADLADDKENGDRARKRLNKDYDAFVDQFGPINLARIQYRRPSVVQLEGTRAAAREEARYNGELFDEGSFDATGILNAGATMQQAAAARRAFQETAGESYREGTFNPINVPDMVIDKRPNIDPFMEDQESYRLRAIEAYDDDTGTSAKTLVFTENVITREVEPKIDSVHDAVLFVLNKKGRLDINAVAEAAGTTPTDAIEKLGDSIFLVPGTDDTWVVRDEYLSGDVRKKWRQAKAAAERNPAYKRNADALEAALPEDLAPADISANLGMPWLPAETIAEFGKDALGLESLDVSYVPKLALWTVTGDDTSAAAISTWGTEDMAAPVLISHALNRQTPRVVEVYYDEGKRRERLDPVATEAVTFKMAEIKARFSDWLWEDQERSDKHAELYNESYNNLVVREFNGDYLTTPGVSTEWKWRDHQRRVVARIIQDGNTYMAHAVGAGKTSAMIGAGMEMRRLGLVRKPMFTVPNHMLGQFTKEFYEQYPTARIAVADEQRFHTSRRKQFVADVANSDLDAIIITHSAFNLIPISATFQDNLIQQEVQEYRTLLDEIGKDPEQRFTRRRLENAVERLEQRLSGKGNRRTDQVITFEEMGVDFLFVDEAHEFRKLDFATKMSTMKGIDPDGSNMAWDLFVKTRYLQSINPNRNLVLASGTPVTNTMAELYTVSRYLQPDELDARSLGHFDAWAGAFGETLTEIEQNAAGGYKPATRFSNFVNIPELSAMVRQRMDVVTSEQLADYVTRPQLKGGERSMHLAEPTDALVSYQQDLDARMTAIENRKGPPAKGDDILLSVIGDGRKAAIDMRLVSASYPNDKGSKLNLLVDEVFKVWEASKRAPFHDFTGDGYSKKPVDFGPATQMVFANLGVTNASPLNVHKYIRSALVRLGVQRAEIVLMSEHRNNQAARQRVFNDMNDSTVRILIGSTAMMATGVNAQRHMIAVHNLDPLWFPSLDEQRNGRLLRQGNMNPEVEIHQYSTKGTYDSQMWGMMARKARFIEAFFRGDPSIRSMEDFGEASQFEQAKAMTTADPRLIELATLKDELEKAKRRQSSFDRDQHQIRGRIARAEGSIERAEERIPLVEEDIGTRTDTSGDNFTASSAGKSFDDRAEFGDSLVGQAENLISDGEKIKSVKLGALGGFEVFADTWQVKVNNVVETHVAIYFKRAGGRETEVFHRGSARGLVQSLEAAIRHFDQEIVDLQEQIAKAQADLKDFKPKLGEPFKDAERVEELRVRVKEIERSLTAEAEKPAAVEIEEDRAESLAKLGRVDLPGGRKARKAPRFSQRPAQRPVSGGRAAAEADRGHIAKALEARLKRFGIADKVAVRVSEVLETTVSTATGGKRQIPIAGRYSTGPIGLIEVALRTQAGGTKTDAVWVLSHETVHMLREYGLIGRAEWATLAKAARADTERMAAMRKEREGQGATEHQITEEVVADMFADWAIGASQTGGAIKRAFMRVRGFFVALRETLTGAGYNTVADIYGAIERGEVGRRKPTKRNLRQTPRLSRKPVRFSNEETEKRYQEARVGLEDGRTMVVRVREWGTFVAEGFARHYIELPNVAEWAKAHETLRQLEAAPEASKEEAVRTLEKITRGFNERELELFSRKVLLEDLEHEVEQGHALPFALTPETLAVDKAAVDVAFDSNKKLVAAWATRQKALKTLKNRLIEAGILNRETATNEAYFRHQVLQYARAWQFTQGAGGRIRRPRPGYAKHRAGSLEDINANYLEAEFDYIQRALVDLKVAETLEKLKRDYDVHGDAELAARTHNAKEIRKILAADLEKNGYIDAKGKETSPLNEKVMGWRQRIAMGFQGLSKETESDNRIPERFDAAVASLSRRRDEEADPDEGGDVFKLLAFLVDRGEEGARGAATVLKNVNERRAWRKEVLTKIKQFKTFRDMVPEGYRLWQPEKGNYFFTAKSIPEHVVDRLLDKLATEDVPGVSKADLIEALSSIRDVVALGSPKYEMVIKEELAATLDKIRPDLDTNIFAHMVEQPMRYWKRWVLINPRRVLKYNINNLSGDLDAVIAGNPRALKKLPEAIRELWNVMHTGDMSARYKEAVERGVFNSGLSIQEIPDINVLAPFEKIMSPPKVGKQPVKFTTRQVMRIWRVLKEYTQFRENWMRYAAYLDYVERLEGGEGMKSIGYGATKPELVDNLDDPKDKAGLLARELVGDYGNISHFGQGIRRYLIPFWSWTEINTKRYVRLFRNAWGQGGGAVGRVAGVTIWKGAKVSAHLYIRMAILYTLVSLYNNVFHGDDEDELNAEDRVRLHLNLGRDEDGTIRTLRFQGALSDFLSWFGLENAVAALVEIEAGRASAGDVLLAVAKAPLNKLAGSITPLIRTPFELATKQSFWPDMFNPRPIRDRLRESLRLFSLENEYDWLSGKPTRGYGESLSGAVISKRNVGESAYFRIKTLSREFLQRERGTSGMSSFTSPRSEALYSYRLAKRFGDKDAEAKYLEEMKGLGMKRKDLIKSIKRAHPLGGLPKKYRRKFYSTLTTKEREQLSRATKWYAEVFSK